MNSPKHRQFPNKNIKLKFDRKLRSAGVTTRSKLRNIPTVDLKKTQYKLIKQVVEKELEWKVLKPDSDKEADVIWTDWYVSEEEINDLLPNQKINHFPGSYQLGNKHFLAKNINKIKKHFPQQYRFFPDTWLLPDDFEIFRNQKERSKSQTWILKPANSCQGKGIMITNDLQKQKVKGSRKHYVLQHYIKNPYLINSLKFDFRLYVLVTSLKPLEVYIYKEGLARLATSSYKQPHKNNLSNPFMHLTNYAINKKNPTFSNQEEGHKRKFSNVLEILQNSGVDISILMQKISKSIVNTIISAQPSLSHLYTTSAPNRVDAKNCFEILGFDVLLDQNLQPYIMEVNHTPSFRASSDIDKEIKSNLIKDTLRFVCSKKMGKKSDENQKFQWNTKNNYEYKLIYPIQSSKQYHQKILDHAQLIFDLWTGVVKKSNNTTSASSQVIDQQKQSNFPKRLIARKSIDQVSSKLLHDYSQVVADKSENQTFQKVGKNQIPQEKLPSSLNYMIPRVLGNKRSKSHRYSNRETKIQPSKMQIQQPEQQPSQKKGSSVFISKFEKIQYSNNLNFKKGNAHPQQYFLIHTQFKKSPLKVINFKPISNTDIRVSRRVSNNISRRVNFA